MWLVKISPLSIFSKKIQRTLAIFHSLNSHFFNIFQISFLNPSHKKKEFNSSKKHFSARAVKFKSFWQRQQNHNEGIQC